MLILGREEGGFDMNMVTFNPFRTLGIPKVRYIKPAHMFDKLDLISNCDVLLFPEYWQVNTLVYGLKKPVFPSIESIHLGHNKIEMTRVLMATFPEHVPYTEILSNSEENQRSILDQFSFPFVAKEVKNSMGRGVFFIESSHQMRAYAAKNDVLYIQEYIPSDRDLRVVVVGEEIVTAYWKMTENSFLHNVAQGGIISFEHIPQEALSLVLEVARTLNINHAGFDLIFRDDHPYILEFNILFGNQGIIEAGISIEQKIYEYLSRMYDHRPFPSAPHPTKPTSPVSA